MAQTKSITSSVSDRSAKSYSSTNKNFGRSSRSISNNSKNNIKVEDTAE